MDQGLGSDRNGSIDKSRVFHVKPLRCLVPVFPNAPGMSLMSTPQPTPFVCVPPTGPFPPGVQPFYPFLAPNESGIPTRPGNYGFGNSVPAPVPLSACQTKRGPKNNQREPFVSGFSIHVADADDVNNTGKRRGRPKKMQRGENGEDYDYESLVNNFLSLFKLKEFDDFRRANGDNETVGTILMVFDLLRKRLTQIEEARQISPGLAKRSDLKASNLLMTKGFRTNNGKRIGHVPGIAIGDIFFFRMELCIVGLHAPSMAGIDYMSVKSTGGEEPVAVSIVSSGGYDDGGDDSDVLIYSGQGGVNRRDGQMFDQKLERGNLALEKSLHHGNDVRVLRGIRDIAGSANSRIYVYDGLYKIQESWAEKKSGCNVFKYKLVRVPGQPEAFSMWKSIQQWKAGTAPRPGTIITDITSGTESQPVTLVNDVDGENGPAHFTYISTLRFTQPFSSVKPSSGCHCSGGCQPGDGVCPCNMRNDGFVPYSSNGVLLANASLIHECGTSCSCPPNCRNRISQAGPKARLEVFKTRNRGWGLRSWDPIRAGTFICEYAGDVIAAHDLASGNDDNYVFDATRYYEALGPVCDDSSGSKAPFPLVISAKNNGNVARFMNHSCSPTVFWKPVLRESNNDVYLHIAFFAIRHVPPMQELTFDYGIVTPEKGDKGKKKCLCGSVKCRGYFY